MKRIAKLCLGWGFFGLGVIGCFLPILQGFLFMAVGLIFLADESPFLQKYVRRLEHKYPVHMQKVYGFRDGLKRKVRRLLHWER